MSDKLECTCIEAYKSRKMRDPNCCACSCDHNDLVDQLAKANERVKELERELTLSTDQNDLLLDEFVRVKLLTGNTEIHALCERAHVRMRQKVSVIDRNHKLEKEVNGLRRQVEQLRKEQE